ncbi:MAG TPA: rhodanese-like domain-containing protein [Candidatus Melainabacteria bacterium]|nr:rhodanese-like domain-containing protein [Candidatus Melainabacteria bacterium]
MPTSISEISSEELYKMMLSGQQLQIVDVREPGEYNAFHVADTISVPLSSIYKGYQSLAKDRKTYLLCQSGKRAQSAAAELAKLGLKDAVVVKDGLNAWQKCGLPVQRFSNIWSMERQVRFTAGFLSLVGIALSTCLNPNWLILSAVVALGMIVSSVSNTCAMANLLQMMPWNNCAAPKSEK